MSSEVKYETSVAGFKRMLASTRSQLAGALQSLQYARDISGALEVNGEIPKALDRSNEKFLKPTQGELRALITVVDEVYAVFEDETKRNVVPLRPRKPRPHRR